ncbi:hypothetical protein CSUB01_11335 [Colletotrichum sublineola]|uniref:Aminoglycoside phosphotransferase domain-containing protein n=1 Tax=Colletotrichum sublineola TaxID=1173701 RepID=A0A066XDZ0_COLSU|nr:hypothetical protein CSUB01_11335 [Colletotrichum sublineola]
METVKSTLNIPGACSIELLGGGAFNKLYIVRYAEKEVVARNTGLPVPEVLGFNADRGNPIGFEWIIMSKVPGRPWADAWREIPFSAKEELVRQIASFCSETFAHRFYGIGNLFPGTTPDPGPHLPEPKVADTSTEAKESVAADGPPSQERPDTDGCFNPHSGPANVGTPSVLGINTVQRIVSSAFIGVDVDPKIPRGPFPTSRERRLNRVLESDPADVGENANDSKTAILGPSTLVEGERMGKNKESRDSSDDEDNEDGDEDPEELQSTLEIITKLRAQMSNFFPPPGGPEFEPSVIYHDDMSRHNILVDDEGALTAVVDWECVSALPLYIACQYPPFLQGRPRDVEPIKSMYQHDEEGNVVELYWEHLEDYELTQLRRLFLEEMGKLQPEWVSIFNKSQRQRDYDLAVTSCDDTFMIRRILTWLSDLESRADNPKARMKSYAKVSCKIQIISGNTQATLLALLDNSFPPVRHEDDAAAPGPHVRLPVLVPRAASCSSSCYSFPTRFAEMPGVTTVHHGPRVPRHAVDMPAPAASPPAQAARPVVRPRVKGRSRGVPDGVPLLSGVGGVNDAADAVVGARAKLAILAVGTRVVLVMRGGD